MAVKNISAQWGGQCHYCTDGFPAGATVKWDTATKAVYHPKCYLLMLAKQAKVGEEVLAHAIAAINQPAEAQAGPIVVPPVSSLKEMTKMAKAGKGQPKTQKARGIKALQQHGILSTAWANVALTEDEAVKLVTVTAAGIASNKKFMRPCPIVPRHGFVDSRVVETEAEVRALWAEARKVDPEAEAIIMPWVEAEHNMLWRPGLLSCGEGHDGATAGINSISVFLQPEYSTSTQTWQKIAADAGVDLEKSDPYIEAVSAAGYETVVTQVRAGDKIVPTEPDWCPEEGFTVKAIVTRTPEDKKIPGKMEAWMDEAKALPYGTAVYCPGDNMGSHWAVHCKLQLQDRGVVIPVLTTRCPTVGEVLPEMGVKPVPLDAQSMLWGFLGGLLGPSMKYDGGTRKRCCCAAMMGAHHGLRMGGDGSQHIGASVAFLLRLSQAALWGEARHAEHKGISRDQVYKGILDDWERGRERLAEKVSLFHTYHWGGSFGGLKWAAIGHGCVALDRAVLDLIKSPSSKTAVEIVSQLNTLINLMHNGNWFLDKFIEPSMWNVAADLDPRVALLAGPVWYQATTVAGEKRVELLDRIEKLEPVKIPHKAPKGKSMLQTGAHASAGSVHMGSAGAGVAATFKKTGLVKVASGIEAEYGTPIPILSYGKPVKAQCVLHGNTAHIQIKIAAVTYITVDMTGIPDAMTAVIGQQTTAPSMAGTGTPYYVLPIATVAGVTTIACLGNCV